MTDDVRAEVLATHGLPEGAGAFLTGETIDELETSARQLGQLMKEHGHQAKGFTNPVDPQHSDPVATALHANQERQRQRAQTILGRPRPRDERGQFVARGGGFDGGARPLAPARPRDPAAEHNRAVGQLANRATLSDRSGGWHPLPS
jgi:hypothetical protein